MFRVNMPQKIYQSKAVREVKRRIIDAIAEPGGILAVIGEIGIGKTIATIDALGAFEEFGHRIIYCRQPDKERLRISVIINGMIRYFGETPRKDIDARTEQLRRLLGQAQQDSKKVILVIDEAHALHYQTLRALKRLLELNFGRRIGLLTVVLVAQPEIYEKLNQIEEVALRTDILEMRPLTREESKEFLKFVADWNRVDLDAGVCDFLAARAEVPLRLVVAVDRVNELGRRIGAKVTVNRLKQYVILPLRRKMEDSGLSLRKVAQKTGFSPSTISQVLGGKYEGDTKKVIEEVEKVLSEV